MAKPKKELLSVVRFGAPISREMLYNANNDRQVVDYLAEHLPPFIEEEDFDTVSKELWLQGYWIERKHPGYCIVCVEGEEYTARIVAGYARRWLETRWTLRTLKMSQ